MTIGSILSGLSKRPERLAQVVALVLSLTAPTFALAHSGGASPAGGAGLAIAAISHGEMALIDEHLQEIVSLAKVQTASAGPARRLLNYYNVQLAYCFWGLAPGGVLREESPFNPCAHAYLAAAKALLLVMAQEPSSQRPAADILARLEQRRQAMPEAGAICSSSDEGFNTSAIVRPAFSEVVADPATRFVGAGGLLAMLGLGLAFTATRRKTSRSG
jgi:hypothetical protein